MSSELLIFNPRSAPWKHRLPNSILQVAQSVKDLGPIILIDGNMEQNPIEDICKILDLGTVDIVGITVMPGPQLTQAIPLTKKIAEEYPHITVVWGGYFASNQHKVVLESGWVDYVINGPGDEAFPQLVKAIREGKGAKDIKNLIYRDEEGVIHNTGKAHLPDLDAMGRLPYELLDERYALNNFLPRTFLGNKTIAYHSSFGCPFTCSFCAVVPIYNARWKGRSAKNIAEDVKYLIDEHGADSVEFHDNNFFTSRKRVVEFAQIVENWNIKWWGEGRIDTMDKYSDEDLHLMKNAGCEMIFFGAETGNDDVLKQMDKGGTQTAEQILRFAGRLKTIGIIPEYSFVLGLPGENEESVMNQINQDIEFIKKVKKINPDTEIIIYLYSPVPSEGSELFEQIKKAGFEFPSSLEEWLDPVWENFDLRKNPLTPWLKPYMVDRIKNFETVLNGAYPSKSCFRIVGAKKGMLKLVSKWRYNTGVYKYPYEIKALHKIWKYRQPEIAGFYTE